MFKGSSIESFYNRQCWRFFLNFCIVITSARCLITDACLAGTKKFSKLHHSMPPKVFIYLLPTTPLFALVSITFSKYDLFPRFLSPVTVYTTDTTALTLFGFAKVPALPPNLKSYHIIWLSSIA